MTFITRGVIAACLLFLLATASVAQEFNVNLKNVTLQEFLTFVSEFTGTNFVYEANDLKGTVTIDSTKQMKKQEILDIFYATIKSNNLMPVNRGGYVQIVRERDVKDIEDEFVGDGRRLPKEAFLTTVIGLEELDAVAVAATVNKLRTKFGSVDPVKGVNVVVIRDTAERIDKIRDIINDFEARASDKGIRAIVVKNAAAATVAQKISQLFAELNKRALGGADPVVIPDEFSNTLIISASEADFRKISYVVEQLDAVNTESRALPRVYSLRNANAEDVDKVLNKLLSSVVDPKTQQVVKSNVAYDKATNSIIVVGDAELYRNVESLIEKLDVPRKQVYVEALIMETTLEKGSTFGVEWMAGGAKDGNAGSVGFLSNPSTLSQFQGPTLDGDAPGFGALPGGFNLGVLGDIVTYEGVAYPTMGLLVSALRSDSGINILSNPQILTLDNEEAEIFVGENRPFLTSEKFDSNNNPIQTYDYRDVGVKLNVVPQISSDDTITLAIDQEVKKVTASSTASAAPVTLTRATKTRVKLEDGSIMVISGLMRDDSVNSVSRVPFLSRIPLLGWFFKSKTATEEKTNLMVFISTSIIRNQAEAEELTRKKVLGEEPDALKKRALEVKTHEVPTPDEPQVTPEEKELIDDALNEVGDEAGSEIVLPGDNETTVDNVKTEDNGTMMMDNATIIDNAAGMDNETDGDIAE